MNLTPYFSSWQAKHGKDNFAASMRASVSELLRGYIPPWITVKVAMGGNSVGPVC